MAHTNIFTIGVSQAQLTSETNARIAQDDTLVSSIATKLNITDNIVEPVTSDPTGNAPSAAHIQLAYDIVNRIWYRVNAGVYEPEPTTSVDLDVTRHNEVGNAPAAGVIPTVVSDQTTRDTGDLAAVTFDDYVVWYSKTATVWVEDTRLEKTMPAETLLSATALSGAAPAGLKQAVTRIAATGQTILYDVDGGNYREIFNSNDLLVAKGTDAERLVYVGPAIEWYSTDAEQWWDLVADTWTKRAGTGYVPPDASTVTNAQLTAILDAIAVQKISDGVFSDTDVAAYNAARTAAGV